MGKIPKVDLVLIRAMLDAGILENVDQHRLDPRGTMLLTCSDGNQFPDIFRHQNKLYRRASHRNPCLHTFALNGGALRLAPRSPANIPGRSLQHDLLDEIRDASAMKNLKKLALYIHWPCGKASAASLSLLAAMNLMFAAKREVKAKAKGISVACFVQVRFSTRRKRTYFVSQTKFLQWSTAGVKLMAQA